jgi:hypothetical protein
MTAILGLNRRAEKNFPGFLEASQSGVIFYALFEDVDLNYDAVYSLRGSIKEIFSGWKFGK